MNPKRKVSSVDERMIRENEYIGRVLNEKVKELDKLKAKFERKLQQEKEKFAVHHLSVTSNFSERKDTSRKKKISLAFDYSTNQSRETAQAENILKSRSDSQLSTRKERDEAKADCLFPPLNQDPLAVKPHKTMCRSLSEGIKIEQENSNYYNSGRESTEVPEKFNASKVKRVGRRSHVIPNKTHLNGPCEDGRSESDFDPQPIAEVKLPKWQKDAIERERRESANTSRGGDGNKTRVRSLTWCGDDQNTRSKQQSRMDLSNNCEADIDIDITCELDKKFESKVLKEGEKSDATNEKAEQKATKKENGRKQSRVRKASHMAKHDANSNDECSDTAAEVSINIDSIARVNMVKNLTKQQRIELEHQVTFLPPMTGKFRHDVNSDSRDNAKDTKRISMARKRWLKAYDMAKGNFQGKGPKEYEKPIEDVSKDENSTPENCTKDPRLLGLVSLLCKPHSLCIRKDPACTRPSNIL